MPIEKYFNRKNYKCHRLPINTNTFNNIKASFTIQIYLDNPR